MNIDEIQKVESLPCKWLSKLLNFLGSQKSAARGSERVSRAGRRSCVYVCVCVSLLFLAFALLHARGPQNTNL